MFCRRFKLVTKSELDWENKLIEYFFKELVRKDKSVPKSRIYRILRESAPDFYSLGFNSVIEIKRITDSKEKSGNIIFSKKGLDKLSEELNKHNPLTGTTTGAIVWIPECTLIKDRGKEFDQLLQSIIEALRARETVSPKPEHFFKIRYTSQEDSTSQIMAVHGTPEDVHYLNPTDLNEPIRLAIIKANGQLSYKPENMPDEYLRILVLCKYNTLTEDPNDIKFNVLALLEESPEIFSNIDKIYIVAKGYFEIILIK